MTSKNLSGDYVPVTPDDEGLLGVIVTESNSGGKLSAAFVYNDDPGSQDPFYIYKLFGATGDVFTDGVGGVDVGFAFNKTAAGDFEYTNGQRTLTLTFSQSGNVLFKDESPANNRQNSVTLKPGSFL